jgi:UDP-N-acetylmuramoylalanine--D-glutamate ligase
MLKEIKNKKVLIFGLGILGGGVEAVKWFYKNGAKIVITDKKTKKELLPSIKKLKKIKAKYILEEHRFDDIDSSDIVYFNPGVSYKSEWVKYARGKGKEIVNDCYLFFKYSKGDIIAITGTRGKTTITTWIYKLLEKFFGKEVLLGGNQPERSLFKILNKTKDERISVLEISSFQLEFYSNAASRRLSNIKASKIAIITNIYNDHLNRYSGFEEYAEVKAKIFQNQTEDDFLIFNLDNKWTNFFLRLKPKSQVYFVSLKKKPKKGIYIKDEKVFIRDGKEHQLFSIKKFKEIYGEHNLYNLLFALLAVYLYLKYKNIKNPQDKIKKLKNFILNLKTPKFRQEIVYKNKNLIIVNDSAATSPDATINAIGRFKKYNCPKSPHEVRKNLRNLILITGGTDKNLGFKDLAKKIKKEIKAENLILLNGSATKKLIEELRKIEYPLMEKNIFEDLKEAVKRALHNTGLILFSPAAASFEKFKNEFDRGKKFNTIMKIMLK